MKKINLQNGFIILNIEKTVIIKRDNKIEIYSNGIRILTLNNEKEIDQFMEVFDEEFQKYNVDNKEVPEEEPAK